MFQTELQWGALLLVQHGSDLPDEYVFITSEAVIAPPGIVADDSRDNCAIHHHRFHCQAPSTHAVHHFGQVLCATCC